MQEYFENYKILYKSRHNKRKKAKYLEKVGTDSWKEKGKKNGWQKLGRHLFNANVRTGKKAWKK